MVSAKKLTIIDVLNEYLAKGKMPPKELLAQVAQSEALKKPAIDPVNMAAGMYPFGVLREPR